MSNPMQAAVSDSLSDPVQAAQDAIDHFHAVYDTEEAARAKAERERDTHRQNAEEALRSADVWIRAKQILVDAQQSGEIGGDQ